jgi:hypothetical protein
MYSASQHCRFVLVKTTVIFALFMIPLFVPAPPSENGENGHPPILPKAIRVGIGIGVEKADSDTDPDPDPEGFEACLEISKLQTDISRNEPATRRRIVVRSSYAC